MGEGKRGYTWGRGKGGISGGGRRVRVKRVGYFDVQYVFGAAFSLMSCIAAVGVVTAVVVK